MKISKILAGCAALAMAASTAMAVSAADTGLWIQDWKVAEQKQVISFDNMDTASAWNGCWVQFYSTNQSLDDVTLTFKVDTTNATWQTDDDGNKMNETGTYTVLRVNNGDETDKTTQAMYENNENVGGYECVNDNGVYTITVRVHRSRQLSMQAMVRKTKKRLHLLMSLQLRFIMLVSTFSLVTLRRVHGAYLLQAIL